MIPRKGTIHSGTDSNRATMAGSNNNTCIFVNSTGQGWLNTSRWGEGDTGIRRAPYQGRKGVSAARLYQLRTVLRERGTKRQGELSGKRGPWFMRNLSTFDYI